MFSTSGHTASYKLGKMILPQLEAGNHGVEVVGMFFFDDNTFVLREGDPVGERLGRVAAEHGMLLMLCWLVVLFGLGKVAMLGVAVVGILLLYEHSMVSPKDLRRMNAAFFTLNGVISVVFFAFIALDVLTQK